MAEVLFRSDSEGRRFSTPSEVEGERFLHFPKGFLWGTATAAHQVEGNNKNNDWWEFEQQGKTKGGETSGIAVDHYNRFEEDFDIAKSLHQNAHRFSIEWSRIEPEEGRFDMKEVEHYRQVIKALKTRGMEPMVTLFHYTSPLWFAKKGGWESRGAVEAFANFVEFVVKNLGEEVIYWIAINEPTGVALQGYFRGEYPPGVKSFPRALRVGRILAKAHNEAYRIIHRHLENAQVGIANSVPLIKPLDERSPLDRLVTKIVDYLSYKRLMRQIKGKLDFLGVQNYHFAHCKFKLGGEYLGIAEEYGVHRHLNGLPKCDRGWEIYPEAIYDLLIKMSRYNLPMIVTEDGIADAKDRMRTHYIRARLVSIHKAMRKGADVRGYFHWTLMDNFEWVEGRSARYGLVEIDYENNLERKIRPSAKYFAQICKDNALRV